MTPEVSTEEERDIVEPPSLPVEDLWSFEPQIIPFNLMDSALDALMGELSSASESTSESGGSSNSAASCDYFPELEELLATTYEADPEDSEHWLSNFDVSLFDDISVTSYEPVLNNGEDAMKGDIDDGEAMIQPYSEPMKTELEYGTTSEETIKEVVTVKSVNIQDVGSCEYAVNGNVDDEEILMEPHFVSVDCETTSEKVEATNHIEDFPDESDDAVKEGANSSESIMERDPLEAPYSVETVTPEGTAYVVDKTGALKGYSDIFVTIFKPQPETNSITTDAGEGDAITVYHLMMDKPATSQTDVSEVETSGIVPMALDQLPENNTDNQNTSCVNVMADEGETSKSKTKERKCCKFCGKVCAYPSALVVHERFHTGEKPFLCPHCEGAFQQKSALVEHLRSHTGDKPYRCTDCGKNFSTTSYLKVHMRSHTGEKPHKCPECGKSFRQRGHLVGHRRCHTNERPYKCPECETSFKKMGDVITHMRVHTGERPFICTDCGENFAQRGHLQKHRRRLHK